MADPKLLPADEWSKKNSSLYGFSLSSPGGAVQSAVFYPMLCGRNSAKKAGETLKGSWYIICAEGSWTDALNLINTKIFSAGNIFRRAHGHSLSDTILNIADYLKNPEASGWSADLKGRLNIEAPHCATQASPLAELELALLTGDEAAYEKFSLPTIEFTLSRKSAHFSDEPKPNMYSGAPHTMTIPSTIWYEDYYYSLNRLLDGNNPWLKSLGTLPKRAAPYSSLALWTVLFGKWLAEPSDELLQEVKTECDKWLAENFKDGLSEEND